MKSINTSKVSGTEELLPEVQASFDNLKKIIIDSYRNHGYLNVETPTLERTEVLLAKAGGETEKQIYNVFKTGEKNVTKATESLRFDHTVPLARYIIEHENDLTFPLKIAQVGINFRGERAQKGRFREFYQCDIDVVGRDSLSLAYDADVISTLLDTFSSFDLGTPVLARINNRKILSGLLTSLNIDEKAKEIYGIIDHSEKVTPEQTKVSLEELKLDKDSVKTILDFVELNGSRSEVIAELNNLGIENEMFNTGVAELDQMLYLLEALGLKENILADMKIVRGLDYYTGTVFEFILPEYKNIGSVCGGGRYENLANYFTNKSFPGVGGSIGLTRLFYVLNEQSIIKAKSDLIDYAIIPVSEHEFDEAMKIGKKLREKDYSVTVVLTNKKLGDKMSYASKIARNGVVIGEAEINATTLNVKDFTTGETSVLNLEIDSKPEDFWAN